MSGECCGRRAEGQITLLGIRLMRIYGCVVNAMAALLLPLYTLIIVWSMRIS